MFQKEKYVILIVLLATLNSVVFATGPSSIESLINPIGINEKGEVLCRTRFSKNELGRHAEMKVVYGYCIITNDSIIQHKTQEIEPKGFPMSQLDVLNQTIEFWDSIFDSSLNPENICEIGYNIRSNYNFKAINKESYRIDKSLNIIDFEKEKGLDLTQSRQLALNGAKSNNYFKEKTIQILYDFEDVLIIKNEEPIDGVSTGASFNYENKQMHFVGREDNAYDSCLIYGVLFVKQKNKN